VKTPPGVDPEVFESALSQWRETIGEQWVFTGDADLDLYRDAYTPFRNEETEIVVAAALAPETAEQVQQIMRVANRHKIPIYPISTGRNLAYGGSAPVLSGSVVLDLKRLNRILEVNERNAYVLLEPGVSYFDLYRHLRDNGYKLWIDCPDPGWGSLIGNSLEHGAGYTVAPHRDHFDSHCGMEIVLPDGSLIYTGGYPPSVSRTWNVHKWGVGPYLEGLFTQSNFGIVTRMGIWLMPEPEAYRSFTFELRDEQYFPAVIDALRRLALDGVIDCAVHMLNDVCMLTILSQYPREGSSGETCLSEGMLAALRRRYMIPPWSFAAALYGTSAQIRVNRRLIRRALGPYGRMMFFSDQSIAGLQWGLRLLKNVKSLPPLRSIADSILRGAVGASVEVLETARPMHAYFKGNPGEYFGRYAYFKSDTARPDRDLDPARDGCGVMWLAPVAPCTGKDVTQVLDIGRPLFQKFGFDFWAALLLDSPRSMIILFSIFYRKTDAGEAARSRALYEALAAATLRAGYPQYRTSIAYMDRLWQDVPDYQNLLEKIKTALDPAHVIAPGRYGIGSSGSTTREPWTATIPSE